MSAERYGDNVKRNRPVGDEELGVTPKNEAPTLNAPETDTAKAPQPTASAASPSQPVPAAPMRPLNLPMLPGINNGFSIEVDSTADDNDQARPAQPVTDVTSISRPAAAAPEHVLYLPVLPGISKKSNVKAKTTPDDEDPSSLEQSTDAAASPSPPPNLPVLPGISKKSNIQPNSTPDDSEQSSPAQPVGAMASTPQPVPAAPTASSSQTILAAPTRQLDLPALPGINKKSNVNANSIANENGQSSPAEPSDAAASSTPQPVLPVLPGISKESGVEAKSTPDNSDPSDQRVQEQNWQNAAKVAKQNANAKDNADADSEKAPLHVRLSFLPNPNTAPVATPKRAAKTRAVEIPSAPKAAAVCATPTPVLDSYKQKQLEAIQGDRQTLQALQSAIKALGLEKQLNFLGGSQDPASGTPSPGQTTIPTKAAP